MTTKSNALCMLLNPDKGNVLVVGNSGVGKSTLINAVMGEDCTVTGRQAKGVTTSLSIYENDILPLRLIDTIGFEEGKKQAKEAIKAIQTWIKESAQKNDVNKIVNEIWFCIDGTSSRLFSETIKKFEKSISKWPDVPVIIVLTKSYSSLEREENINMVQEALDDYKNQDFAKRMKKIIPVVAERYQINEDIGVLPEGIEELVEETMAFMPIGKKKAEQGVAKFQAWARRRKVVGVVGGSAIGAFSLQLKPGETLAHVEKLEKKELLQIAEIYGIKENSQSVQQIMSYLTEEGFLKQVSDVLDKIVGLIPTNKLPEKLISSFVTAGLVIGLGAVESFIFNQLAIGKKTDDDMLWAKEILEEKLTLEFVKKMQMAVKNIGMEMVGAKKLSPTQLVGILMDIFFGAEEEKKVKAQ